MNDIVDEKENIISDNLSITRLFISKKVDIIMNNRTIFYINAMTLRDLMLDDVLNATFVFITDFDLAVKQSGLKTLFKEENNKNTLNLLKIIFFSLSRFNQYKDLANKLEEGLHKLFPQIEVDTKEKEFIINDVIITSEIWEYVIYVLKLLCGEKVTQPLHFVSPEAKAAYEQQKAFEERIAKIKQKGKDGDTVDKDGLIKVCMLIVSQFPSFTIDYLFNQTLAQIHWLHFLAAGAVSYSFKEKAFAAGNVKKNSKLEFYIK